MFRSHEIRSPDPESFNNESQFKIIQVCNY
jgi:hypothetical protein